MRSIWTFFQDQILGMGWLNSGIGTLLSRVGLDITGKIGASVRFFLYDSIKILSLLSALIFMISYVQSHFPPERTKKILGRFKGIGANIISALLGTLTPFCSCSSIPIFIGFTNAGLPVGVTFSFLISSPLVDLGALVLLMSVFGVRIAIAYVLVGLVLAVAGGTLIDKLGMEKYVERFGKPKGNADFESPELTKKDRLLYARDQTLETVKKVWLYVLVGVGIGALIPQLDSRRLDPAGARSGQSLLRSDRHVGRRAYVCRYLRYDSHRGGLVRERRRCRDPFYPS